MKTEETKESKQKKLKLKSGIGCNFNPGVAGQEGLFEVQDNLVYIVS